jgi:hypothetical protein
MAKYASDWIERNTYYRQVAGEGGVPRYVNEDRPVIVCLCGSTRFKEAWYEQTKRLTYEGKIVLGVGDLNPNKLDTNDPIDPTLKARLDELHKRKVDLADEVFVLNVGGYVGESTRSEVLYARRGGKAVRWLEPENVPADLASE